MNTVYYEFDKIHNRKKNGYIFQYIYNRKLSNICHSHNFYELIYILDGNCDKTVNGKNITIKKGDVLFLRPSESHKFLNQSDEIRIVCLSIKKEEFERVSMLYGEALSSEISSFPEILLFKSDRMLSFIRNPHSDYDENDCKLLLCSFLNIYLHMTKEKIPKALSVAMAEIKKEENLREGISAFIRISGYSQSHLARLTKKHLGMNIHEYILTLRLEKAYNDIIFTKEHIEDISESVGYASFSHFNKIFKEKYNITPAQLRKQHSLWTT